MARVMVKDHLFVLLRWGSNDVTVSEYFLRSSISNMDVTHIMTSNKLLIDMIGDYHVHFFACSGFVLLLLNKLSDDGVNRHQVLRLFDTSANDWPDFSMRDDIRFPNAKLETAFMCELRRDAVP